MGIRDGNACQSGRIRTSSRGVPPIRRPDGGQGCHRAHGPQGGYGSGRRRPGGDQGAGPAREAGRAAPVADPEVPALPRAAGDLPTLLLKTRIKSEVERAKLLEIRARVEAGKYVDADDVKVAAFNKAREVRDSLLNIPERLAAVLAAESDERRVHQIMVDEIRSALEALPGGSTGSP